MPTLTIPTDLLALALWIQVWGAVIGAISVPVIDKIKQSLDASSTKARWLSWYVPPAIVLFLALVGLLLGMIAPTSQWLGAGLLIAGFSVFWQRPVYAARESLNKPDQNEGAMDRVVIPAVKRDED
jgi:hypothetical protein